MRRFFLLPVLMMLAIPGWADAPMSVLVDVLKLREAAQILHAEDITYAQELNDDFLDGKGGATWQVQVDAILDPGRVVETVRRALQAEMDKAATDSAVAFFASDLGTRIVDLENTARAAISDDEVEQAARARFAELEATNDPRLMMITGMVRDNDMIDRNVTSAMNANFQFLRGMVEGGAFKMTEEEMLADVAAQEEEIRADTESWLMGYLLMAYHPLNDEELAAYATFSRSDAGQAVNRGLFDGFGANYAEVSYALGRVIAMNMTAKEL